MAESHSRQAVSRRRSRDPLRRPPVPTIIPRRSRWAALVLEAGDRRFSYAFTPEELFLIWTTRCWCTRRVVATIRTTRPCCGRCSTGTRCLRTRCSGRSRASSAPLHHPAAGVAQFAAAARHQHLPADQYVRTGGTYPGTSIPRGQLKRHLDIQRAPWTSVQPSARALAARALSGRLANPGIGLASEFASTKIYYRQRHGHPRPWSNGAASPWPLLPKEVALGGRRRRHRPDAERLLLRPAGRGLPAGAVRIAPPSGVAGGGGAPSRRMGGRAACVGESQFESPWPSSGLDRDLTSEGEYEAGAYEPGGSTRPRGRTSTRENSDRSRNFGTSPNLSHVPG